MVETLSNILISLLSKLLGGILVAVGLCLAATGIVSVFLPSYILSLYEEIVSLKDLSYAVPIIFLHLWIGITCCFNGIYARSEHLKIVFMMSITPLVCAFVLVSNWGLWSQFASQALLGNAFLAVLLISNFFLNQYLLQDRPPSF
ncbi:hypothetical protein ABENE_20665 [Asticcacaulis benevestitus DSM 16100 = ATCC BAA-896]|uniref:Uncharacterized protein n=2 Tax=Asticcacaulis TaxID=76890 RepID=V4P3X7_9CAUL|nr:hypothetical protein ABENE_20665 [Asticcacaulis benevestitus DSM 16100 = ATCC BAA-896]